MPKLTVTLSDFAPGTYVEGQLVQLTPYSATTDSNGVADFSNIAAGTYWLNVSGHDEHHRPLGQGIRTLRITVPATSGPHEGGYHSAVECVDEFQIAKNQKDGGFDVGGSPEGRLTGALAERYWDWKNEVWYTKTTRDGATGWDDSV